MGKKFNILHYFVLSILWQILMPDMKNKRLKTSKQMVLTGKPVENEKSHIYQFVVCFSSEPKTERKSIGKHDF
jgi:hypothetical protein